jgi:hypothetical protein
MKVNALAVGAVEFGLALAFLGYELRRIIEGGLSRRPKLKLPKLVRSARSRKDRAGDGGRKSGGGGAS